MLSNSLIYFSVVALGFMSSVAHAEALGSGSAHRRAHRLLKPRLPVVDDSKQPTDPDQGTVGAAAAPPPPGDVVVTSTYYDPGDLLHLNPHTTTLTVPEQQATPTPTPPPGGGGLGLTIPGLGLGDSSSKSSTRSSSSSSMSLNSTTSTSSTSTRKSSTSSSATSTTSSASIVDPEATALAFTTQIVGGGPSTNSSQSTEAVGASAAELPAATRNVLIAIGVSIAGAIIIWTLIRKWKFNKARRVAPIDWSSPNMEETGKDFDPSRIRRQSGASSFHSGIGNEEMYGSEHAHHAQMHHDRDFTAGTAPIGGYADLSRDTASPTSSFEHHQAPIEYPQRSAYAFTGHGATNHF